MIIENPIILQIETTAKNCSVSISKGKELLCLCEENDEQFSHGEKLHLFIEWALEGAEITLQDLDAVSVSKGPGSYTGLRIGVSSAKGLCYTLGIPLLAINTLDAMIEVDFNEIFDYYIPCIDARRMEIFCKTFDTHKNAISETENIIISEQFFEDKLNKKIAFIGSGSNKIEDLYKSLQIDNNEFKFFNEPISSSKNMIELTLKKYHEKDFEDVAYFEPFYLKPVHITEKKVK